MKKSFVITVLLAAFLINGCATYAVRSNLYAVDYEDKNFIAYIIAAYRDNAGNVTICLRGRPAGADSPISERRDYSFVFPALSDPKLENTSHDAIMRYRPAVTDIKEYCPDMPKGMTPLPIHTVRANDFTRVERARARGEKPSPAYGLSLTGERGERFSDMSNKELTMFFESRTKGPAIYKILYIPDQQIDTGELMTIVYVHDSPIFEGRWAVETGANQPKLKTKKGYMALMPFAVIFDVVTFPVVFLYAIAHYDG